MKNITDGSLLIIAMPNLARLLPTSTNKEICYMEKYIIKYENAKRRRLKNKYKNKVVKTYKRICKRLTKKATFDQKLMIFGAMYRPYKYYQYTSSIFDNMKQEKTKLPSIMATSRFEEVNNEKS